MGLSATSTAVRRNLSKSYFNSKTSVPLILSRGYNYSTTSENGSVEAKRDSIAQGHPTDGKNFNLTDKNIHSEAIRAGKSTRRKGTGGRLDAASPKSKPRPKDTGKGNPEGIGMVDQVGSATGSAEHFEKSQKES